jgi:uncharacterized protein (DUF427 family)
MTWRAAPRPVPDVPGPGQESVWDYPRPPRLERTGELVEVRLQGRLIAATRRPFRVLETSHPPTYYVPREDVEFAALVPTARRTACEWKGLASYADLVILQGEDGVGDLTAVSARVPAACWWYDAPTPAFAQLAGAVAFYPELVEATLDGEPVRGVPGGFYGSWVTSRIVGPFKGGPGTEGW